MIVISNETVASVMQSLKVPTNEYKQFERWLAHELLESDRLREMSVDYSDWAEEMKRTGQF